MIHEGATADRLAIVRIAVFGIWFVRIAVTPVTNYTLLPAELVEPVGLMRLLPMEALLASEPFLSALKVAGLALTLACMLGARPWRPIALAAVLMIVWHDGAMKSVQSYVNHAQIIAMYVALVLAVSPAADTRSVHRRRMVRDGAWTYGGPLLASAFVAALTYSLMGVRRLAVGGVDVFVDGSIERWVATRSQQYAAYNFDVGATVAELPGAAVLLSIGMAVVTVAETGSLLVLRFPRLAAWWLAVLVPFHLATVPLMNIPFWENLILLLALFAFVGHSRPVTIDSPPTVAHIPRWTRIAGRSRKPEAASPITASSPPNPSTGNSP